MRSAIAWLTIAAIPFGAQRECASAPDKA